MHANYYHFNLKILTFKVNVLFLVAKITTGDGENNHINKQNAFYTEKNISLSCMTSEFKSNIKSNVYMPV